MEKPDDNYVVYILECRDGTYYTGITNDLAARFKKHQQGKGAKYTRGRLPVTLKFAEMGKNKSWALRREYEIKRMSRRGKEKLIAERGVSFEDPKEL
ncbi:GIY-YIG nuclease family protein [Paenactinomyces guangxiensis]|uniref:GIY-YIG nuclease family protein n=1 Tax=Paenactinomyces guangxiensis TaxID=1490290 RepID=A0A7W1WTM0_9BACL|nr:GIY-YIG nuclease family protein [Paenactinomyces guangxiensis]MBA4495840.1 GIY-YIG nuclease family protein [Paenactinomyces guangxiensis]MBH8592930.1 GIY-YIG nuclease family protein [Paenactinomyces guangxiensis]